MKKTRLILCGAIALAILAGCANPTIAVSPEPEAPAETSPASSPGLFPDEEPFILNIPVESAGTDRSVAGMTKHRTQLWDNGSRNYVQVIVVDEDNKVVEFKEARQASATELSGTIALENLDFDKPYHYLVLMGHWQRDYTQTGGPYVETEKPTLFQAGIVRSTKPAAEIPVTMMPIFVDTKFKTDDTDVDSSFQMREPPVTTDSKPGKTALLPAVSSGWKIEWTLQGTGFVYLLAAQKAVGITGAGLYGTTASNTSNLGGKGTVAVAIDTRGSTTGGPITPAPTLTYSSGTKTITGAALKPIFGDETTSFALVNDIMTASFSVPSAMVVSGKPQTHAGITGYANFNLKYAPFSKDDTASAFWNGTTSALIGGTPEWIIRNGINDEPQNDLTIFDGNFEGAGNANNFNGTSWTGISNTTPNGNGGIRFEFKLVDDNPTDFPNYPGDELKITSGSYKPKAAPATGGTITFSAEGWTGGATAYYVIQDTQPNLWEITNMLGSANSYTAGDGKTGTINTDPNSKPIWLIVQQGVKVSNIKKIDTGGAGVLPENGIEDNW